MRNLSSIKIFKIMLLVFLIVAYICNYFDTVVSLVVCIVATNQVVDWCYELGLKNIYTDYENV